MIEVEIDAKTNALYPVLYEYGKWADSHIGKDGLGWEFRTLPLRMVFRHPEDATAFKLRFGI